MVTATRAPARRALTAERLARILDLERTNGCHDRAVIGGLDAFLERHAGQSADVQQLAGRLAPARYRELSPAARTTWLNAEIARLTGDATTAPAGAPAPAQPAATAKPAAVRALAEARAKAPPAPPAAERPLSEIAKRQEITNSIFLVRLNAPGWRSGQGRASSPPSARETGQPQAAC